MPSQDLSPTDLHPLRPQLVCGDPLTARERAVLDTGEDDGGGDPADVDLLAAGIDPHIRTWSLGVASEVFFRASALTAAMVAAKQARIAADPCCGPCVAWTTVLQERAIEALAAEIARQAWESDPTPDEAD